MRKTRKRAARRAEAEDILNPSGMLRFLASVPHPLSRDEILRIAGLPRRDKRRVDEMLHALEKEGTVVRTPSGGRTPAARLKSVTGRFFRARRGIAFVTPDTALPRPASSAVKNARGKKNGQKQAVQPESARLDIFIPPAHAGDAFHGDKVRVLLLPGSRGKNPEGRIVEVLERGRHEIAVKVLHTAGDKYVCRTMDPHLNLLFQVDASSLAAPPRPDDLLLVVPQEHLASDLRAAEAHAAFGSEDDAAVQERLVKLNHQAPSDFPPRVLEEAAAFPEKPGPEDLQDRSDLTSLPFVTIDGETARDFDDAVFVRRSEQGFRLYAAIADVTHYVRPGTALDLEARERGNSWYFPFSAEPMLPPRLSNGLCSLKPGTERLALIFELDFDSEARTTASRFYPGIICSAARLTYEEAQAVVDEKISVADELRISLRAAASLAALLRAAREKRGSLDFDIPEAEYAFDAARHVCGIHRKTRLFSHKIIEECMIAVNEAAARFLEARALPVPYRVHPAPDPERLTALLRSLHAVPWAQKMPERPSARDLPAFLRAAHGTAQEFFVSRLCLRAMMQARYQPHNEGHFGLASDAYCHATSPIRRYADILVHRAIKYAPGCFSGPLVAGGKLFALSGTLSLKERAAEEAEREIARRLAVLFLAGREGEIFQAVVTAVHEFGFFAEFVSMPVEGMAHLCDLTDDYYSFDPDRRTLSGRVSGKRFYPGLSLRVVLAEVHRGRLEIRLLPVTDGRRGAAARPRRSSGPRGYNGKRG